MTAPIVDTLEAKYPSAKLQSNGWTAVSCPNHDDEHASFGWKVEADGTVMLSCRAGCTNEAIVAALDHEMRDLFEPKAKAKATVVRTDEHVIRNTAGAPVAIHLRPYLSDGTKGPMTWKLPDGRQGLNGTPQAALPLYGSHLELKPSVVVVEGERCAEALWEIGVSAVATYGASHKPEPAVLELLRGRTVTLWPDNDAPGMQHMKELAQRLAGVAAEVRWVDPPSDAPKGWDVADLLALANDKRQAIKDIRERIGPVPGVVSLARYLDDVRAYVTRYVVFSSEHEPVALALWTAHTHMLDGADVSPLLALTSAEMRSGKTLVLDLLEFIVANPERMVTPSPAATYTAISQRPRPTLMVDESDAIFTRKRKGDADTEGLRAVFNAGNRRGVTVARVEMQGKKRVLERLDVFGAKVLAGIGKLPDTITDRAIVIRMRRKSKANHVRRFRYRRAKALASTIGRPDWDAVEVATEVDDIPADISDRAQDSWEPLLAIADAAGGDWPALARQAAKVLSAEDVETISEGIQLLGDIHSIFDAVPLVPDVPGVTGRDGISPSFASTSSLLQHLYRVGDGRWDDYYGSQLSARRLAQLLDPYGISPRQERVGDDTEPTRGYARRDFEDAWERYLPRPDTSDTSGTSGTSDLPDEADTLRKTMADHEHSTAILGTVLGWSEEKVLNALKEAGATSRTVSTAGGPKELWRMASDEVPLPEYTPGEDDVPGDLRQAALDVFGDMLR